MAQPTFEDLYNDTGSLVTSASYNSGTNTLTVVFSQTVTAAQSWIAIVQAGHKWLAANTDDAVNLDADAISQFTTTRNSLNKLQTNFSIKSFTTNNNQEIDPLGV
jgi:hypothetical protein